MSAQGAALELDTTHGTKQLVAYRHPTEPVATCAMKGCGCPIQRTTTGDLLDGVRAHYRTVHPERRIR